ncbi:DMT family transporter, partial [Escherichia coli]|nr:DMT family transporter [Escherichia coli]
FSFAALGWNVWLIVAYIVLVPTVGAYYLNAWALGRVAPSSVAIYIYLQPLISFAVAPLVLGERIDHRAWVAAALIFAG